ncbi:hypothetical protein [Roseateles sp. P5_D6]
MDVALDRDALYYPYIHVRDVNWLKAALLSFPQVRRVVPRGFELNDLEEVRPFLVSKGARGEPLLSFEPADLYSAYEAQERLLGRLKAADPDKLAAFSRARTEVEFPQNPNSFQMHQGKLFPLLDFLRKNDLAWPARDIVTDQPQDWMALHPRLGEVVMSLISMAIAAEKGLDIVTSSGRVHRALAHMDEEALLSSLFGNSPGIQRVPPDPAGMVDDLCQVVMLTTFDLSRLTAEQVGELQKDGKDLRRFKTELLKLSSSIPDVADPGERDKRMAQAAREVVDQWEKYRRSLPRFALEALQSAAAWKPPELLTSALAGATSTVALASGTGLLVGLGVFAGMSVWRGYKEKTSSPYQYLTRIEQAGAALAPRPVASA